MRNTYFSGKSEKSTLSTAECKGIRKRQARLDGSYQALKGKKQVKPLSMSLLLWMKKKSEIRPI